MTRSIKITAFTAALTGLATPALAHHGEATSTHWLVDHGLLAGAVALVVVASIAYIIRKNA